MNEAIRQQVGKLLHERWGRLGFESLLPAERDHVLLWSLHAECMSGGLHQFIFNSSGDNALETVTALERHGMARTGEVLKYALDQLPQGWCADRSERCRRLQFVEDDIQALDDEYDASIASIAESDSLSEALLAAYRREGLIAESDALPDEGGDSLH